MKSPDAPIRIAKAIASAGLCSRREAERWIEAGRVSVNGKKLETPAFTVTPSDNVIVDDKPLPRATGVRLWRYHKPKGLMTTHNDPEGRRTVFDALPKDMPRVTGRLTVNVFDPEGGAGVGGMFYDGIYLKEKDGIRIR